jgi:hypothetical protein
MSSPYRLDVNVPKLLTIGVVSTLLLVVVLLGAHGYFLKAQRQEFAAKWHDAPNPTLLELEKRAGEQLHTFRWIDQKTGTVQLPIDHAIRIMAATKGAPPTTQPLGRQ